MIARVARSIEPPLIDAAVNRQKPMGGICERHWIVNSQFAKAPLT
ncbi:hypothetical protein [Bradyrhizobium sp. 190]|nr:hypothetical protein [Bradyrhizobium sp. 190]